MTLMVILSKSFSALEAIYASANGATARSMILKRPTAFSTRLRSTESIRPRGCV